MSVQVHIPTPLRPFTDRRDIVEAEGRDVGEVLDDLVRTFPQLRPHLFTPEGQLRSFVNVYRNDEDIRYTGAGSTPVSANDAISIVPSIAGGAPCAGRC